MKSSFYLHLLVSLKVRGNFSPLSQVSWCVMLNISHKNLDFFTKWYFYKKHKQICNTCHFPGFIASSFWEKAHKNSPLLLRLHPSTKIFQQKSCQLVIQAMIVTTEYPVEHNSKRGMVVILAAILMMMMIMIMVVVVVVVVVVVMMMMMEKQKCYQ